HNSGRTTPVTRPAKAPVPRAPAPGPAAGRPGAGPGLLTALPHLGVGPRQRLGLHRLPRGAKGGGSRHTSAGGNGTPLLTPGAGRTGGPRPAGRRPPGGR